MAHAATKAPEPSQWAHVVCRAASRAGAEYLAALEHAKRGLRSSDDADARDTLSDFFTEASSILGRLASKMESAGRLQDRNSRSIVVELRELIERERDIAKRSSFNVNYSVTDVETVVTSLNKDDERRLRALVRKHPAPTLSTALDGEPACADVYFAQVVVAASPVVGA